jgi:hypothetical protein
MRGNRRVNIITEIPALEPVKESIPMVEADGNPTIVFDGTDCFVVFNDVRIAKRHDARWISLEPGWRVVDTDTELNGIAVEYRPPLDRRRRSCRSKRMRNSGPEPV